MYEALTPLISAQSRARAIKPGDEKYDHSVKLGRKPVTFPVAVYLYNRRWTRLLVLDLDAKLATADEVARDARGLRELVEAAGGRVVEDVNPVSGGRHLIVPLAEPMRRDHLVPVLHVLRRMFRTLDLSPMLHDKRGCIAPPGAWTREGARRQLVGDLPSAVQALTVRSGRGLIARIMAELGSSSPTVTAPGIATAPVGTEGTGTDTRLSSYARLSSPLPDHITAFATTGTMRSYWKSTSEARQSVLVAAALRGWSCDDVRAQLAAGHWPGLHTAYSKYRTSADLQLQRDFTKALTWSAANAGNFRSPGHTKRHTGGSRCLEYRYVEWLAHATAWARTEFRGRRHLHQVLAVLQALASDAAMTGVTLGDRPVVETGRRGLSIAAGLLPDTVVGDILAEIRDMEGSPIMRARRASGQLADRYVLIASTTVRESDAARFSQVRVEPVHPAWRIIGLHLRRVYELVVHSGITVPADIYAAAGVGASAGAEALADLAALGLITRGRGHAGTGPVTLDDVAAAHGLDDMLIETIARFRRERAEWWAWLELRSQIPADPGPAAGVPAPPPGWDEEYRDERWSSLTPAAEPAEPAPRSDTELAVLLCMEMLGATIVVT